MLKKSVIKIVLIPLLLTSLFNTNANALSGVQEHACTVLLCLSASVGTRPHECIAPIRKFLKDTLNPRKWYKTVTNRKNFLKLCPTGTNPQIEQAVAGLGQNDEDTKKFDELTNALSEVQPEDCTAEALNKNIEKKFSHTEIDGDSTTQYWLFRIVPTIPLSCKVLYKHSYMNGMKEPKNICNTNKWYLAKDWIRGHGLKVISRAQYLKLNENERQIKLVGSIPKAGADIVRHVDLGDQSYTEYALHYKIIPINKKCWVD